MAETKLALIAAFIIGLIIGSLFGSLLAQGFIARTPTVPPLSMILVSSSNANPCGTGTTTMTCSVTGLVVGNNYLFIISGFTSPFSNTGFTCTDGQGFTTYVAGGSTGGTKTQCSALLVSATSTSDTLTLVGTGNWQGNAYQLFQVTR